MPIPGKQIVTKLAELHGLLSPDGAVMRAEFAERAGIAENAISDVLAGEAELSRDSQLKLIESFGLTLRQAQGLQPITRPALRTNVAPTASELATLRKDSETQNQ